MKHQADPKRGKQERKSPARREPGAFDPAGLPPIYSITAGTDITAFLQCGVPAELVKSALRRAWACDTAIHDIIEIAENQWDFTDPTSVPGFGPIETAGDVHEMMARAVNCMHQAGTAPVQAPMLARRRRRRL